MMCWHTLIALSRMGGLQGQFVIGFPYRIDFVCDSSAVFGGVDVVIRCVMLVVMSLNVVGGAVNNVCM